MNATLNVDASSPVYFLVVVRDVTVASYSMFSVVSGLTLGHSVFLLQLLVLDFGLGSLLMAWLLWPVLIDAMMFMQV